MQQVRKIVLDTETTGLYVENGDRIIEIGCSEIIDGVKTDNFFHAYVNPKREISEGAYKVHGISADFLQDKPGFPKIADEFLEFLGSDSQLVIHNARFDMKFINYELELIGKKAISNNRVIDTLMMARKKFPGSPASLDALCKRFNISLELREKHGALIDAELLSLVYLELIGGSKTSMKLSFNETGQKQDKIISEEDNFKFPYRKRTLNDNVLAQHKEMLKKMKDPIWKKTE